MFKATYEHVVHVESFKNIDLYQQGLYYLRFYISNQGEYATPYNYFEGSKKKDNHHWLPGQIQDDIYAFQTRTFMIRFQEEDVEIDESCIFKIEVPAFPHYEAEFTLTCELMCADIQKIGGPPSDEQLFKCVAVFEGIIKNAYRGVHEYVPVMFDNHHFCIGNCTVHSILQDFKFRLSDLQVTLNQENNIHKKPKVLIQPKSFTEFLHKATQKFTQSQQFFDYYVGQMRETCEGLQQMVAKLCGLLKLYDQLSKLPMIPKYSYIQYQESSIILSDQLKKKNGNIQIGDVLNLKNIKDQNLLGSLIENDVNQFASVLFELQNILVNIIQRNSKEYRIYLETDYQTKVKDKWGETFVREVIKCDNFAIATHCQKQHFDIANQLRKKQQIAESMLDIQNQNLFSELKNATILFEEIYSKGQQSQCDKSTHILVLVHGFQGNSIDMRLIRNHLLLDHPNIHFLCSRANEDQTDGDIGDMGHNLASEVKQYITEYIKSSTYRISFLGHSLGGVIIRAALPHLQEYKQQMYSFISFSSPHLGYAYNNSTLIDAGLWFLKRMRKSISLQQLAMTDTPNIENSFLYQLSRQQGLNWFQNILLVSSAQDQYVPFESARIQKCNDCSDQVNAKKYEKMVECLMGGLRTHQVQRLDVNFILDEKGAIDNMIGRSAHIMFLENTHFLRMLATCMGNIFN